VRVFLSILGTLIDEIVLAVLLLWLLPQLGIRLPLEVTIGILAALAVWSALIYRPIRRAIKKEAPSPKQAMVGNRGTALTELAPKDWCGYRERHGALCQVMRW
jgi:membrane protein implicated in regulation of membrane protease activity